MKGKCYRCLRDVEGVRPVTIYPFDDVIERKIDLCGECCSGLHRAVRRYCAYGSGKNDIPPYNPIQAEHRRFIEKMAKLKQGIYELILDIVNEDAFDALEEDNKLIYETFKEELKRRSGE